MRERAVLEGVPELKAVLEERVVALTTAKVRAMAEEVKAVEDDARAAAPVDTGALRDGITSEAQGLTGVVHTTALHSAAQEFGTTRNAAQPFMGPAAEKSRRRFPERVAEVIRKAVG